MSEVRRSLRDQLTWVQESPAADGQIGAFGAAASKPIRLQRAPIGRTAGVFLTAPAAASNQPGFAGYKPLLDPAPPVINPVVAPTVSDGGGGGTWPAGTYIFVYTYVIGGVEFGMSPLSNTVTTGVANHQISMASVTNLPTTVTALNVYCVNSTSTAQVGLVGSITVTGGTAPTTLFASDPGTNLLIPALLITDTGELFFPIAPASGTVSVQYQTARFGDQQVIDALYEGLDMIWPEIWTPQPFDLTSVLPSPVQWEYVLPAAYADPRTVIQEVETRPPSAFIIFERTSMWRFINDSTTPTLVFHGPPPVGGQVRITYTTPYSTLSQVPTIAQFLPVYYACARLMVDQETMRGRSDDLPALTAENAGSEKGGSLQTASWWMENMFAPALRKITLGPPARRTVMTRSVEKLGLGSIWRGMP